MLDDLLADLPSNHTVAVASRDYLTRLLLDLGRPERASQVASVSPREGPIRRRSPSTPRP